MPQPKLKNRVAGLGWAPELPSIKDWVAGEQVIIEKPGKPKLLVIDPFEGIKPIGESRDRRVGPGPTNPPIINQGNIGSCVGCSCGYYAVSWLRRTDRDKISTLYSALQAYYDARVRDGMNWKLIDSGAYLRDCMDALAEVGIAPESAWPYKPAKFAITPPARVYKAAARWKLGPRWAIKTPDQFMVALDKGMAVVGGLTLYSSLFTKAVDQSGRVPMPVRTDNVEGGHAMYFDRYTMADKLVRNPNSWGEDTGDGGHYYWPMDYLFKNNEMNWDLGDDFWAMQAESPATTPWKD